MTFGLMNAAQTFQRPMDPLFRQLPFVFTYLDDHLIASRTLEEHLEHLQSDCHQSGKMHLCRRFRQVLGPLGQ